MDTGLPWMDEERQPLGESPVRWLWLHSRHVPALLPPPPALLPTCPLPPFCPLLPFNAWSSKHQDSPMEQPVFTLVGEEHTHGQWQGCVTLEL